MVTLNMSETYSYPIPNFYPAKIDMSTILTTQTHNS
jgi:hypothetical protein